jgi:hypothetical protein
MTSVEQPSATFRPTALPGGSYTPRAGHLPFASDLIAALKPSMIVQLGVGYGETYFGFCQIVSENNLVCPVYAVDPWRAPKETKSNGSKPHASVCKKHAQDGHAEAAGFRGSPSSFGGTACALCAFELVSRYNAANYQEFSQLVRLSFDEALPQFEKESIGLLDIDGVAPYDTLKRTFHSWLEKVHPGGVILLHNISLRAGDSGAARLWNEVKVNLPHFAFRHGNGLGVIAKSFDEAAEIPFVAEMLTAQPEERNVMRRYYATCAERLEIGLRPGALQPSEALHSVFQVFRSQDHEYSTIPELTHVASPGVWINLRIDLPEGTGDRPLRLDVASRPAVIDIATLTLRKEDGHSVWNWNPKEAGEQLRTEGSASRLPEPEFFRVLALGASARVFLPAFSGPAFQEPLELEIRFRIDLELKALQELAQPKAEAAAASPAAIEAAIAKTKADSAKYLAQSRIEYDTRIRHLTAEADARVDAIRMEMDGLRSEMEVLKARHQQDIEGQAALLEEERAHHQVTRIEKENLVAQQPLMIQEISIAQGNVEELKAEVERLSGELATVEFDLSELRKLNARMAAALEEERSMRIQMQESGSWQLTKPIRAVGELFGPRRKY